MTFSGTLRRNANIIFAVLVILFIFLVIYIWTMPYYSTMGEGFLDMANYVTSTITGSTYTPTYFQQEYQQLQTAEKTQNMNTVSGTLEPGTQNAGTLQEIYGPAASTFQESYSPKAELNPQDLLPKPNPVSFVGGENMGAQNFLSATALAGINTVGTGKRNPNLQLRSDPPIPQMIVSPWNQSTIGPDPYQRPFEMGSSGSTLGL